MGPCGGLGGIETEKLFNRALPCRFQPQERQGNRAVVSSRLVANVDVLWKRACPRTERASERTRQCIHRTLVDPMSPPTVRPSRQTFRYVGVGKMPTGRLRREEGKKTRRVARVLHTRAHGSLSLKVSWSASSSASARRGRAPGTGCGRGHGRSPASLSPRPKGKLLFCVGVDSSVDATLRGYTQRGGVCRRRAPDQREEVACSRDGDARTYTLISRASSRAAAADTTERSEILGIQPVESLVKSEV